MIRSVPSAWKGSAEAYSQSFARLCAGTVDQLIDAVGAAQVSARLLDIGTGPGTAAAAAHRAGYTVVGMDSDPSMIALARQRHPGLPIVLAALPQLPCRDRSFDAVTANFVVNHTPDPRRAVRELFRVTRDGGRIAATIWTAVPGLMNHLWNDVVRRAEVTPPTNLRLPDHLDFERTSAGFAGLFHDAGFLGVECHETSWTFRIPRDDLWLAVEAGIAVIGQTYAGQSPVGRERMRRAYLELTDERQPSGLLELPSTALIASGRRPP